MRKNISKVAALILCIVICLTALFAISGCKKDDSDYKKNKSLDTSKEVTLTVVGSAASWPELTRVMAQFVEIYPNVNLSYQDIEQYGENLLPRLQSNESIDIFKASNIQDFGDYTKYKDYALNLISTESQETLDLSNANQGIIENYKYAKDKSVLYSVPYGCEMRGMYVNVTLLNKFGLKVPTNRQELLACCETLLQNDYIPMQGPVVSFAQQLLFPMICNQIVNGGNYEQACADIEAVAPGLANTYLRDAYTLIYEIVSKGYYNYKKVEEDPTLGYKFNNDETQALNFLNVKKVDADSYESDDANGKIAFMPKTQAFQAYLDQVKADSNSPIEYTFIPNPVGVDGSYAYLSPADAFAINRNSPNKEWALEFLNYLLTPSINKAFTSEMNKIPNTEDALIEYNIDTSRTCNVGQITFDSMNLYSVVVPLMSVGQIDSDDDLIGISKMNAPKYMAKIVAADGEYVLVNKAIVPYDATNEAHENLERFNLAIKHTLEEYMTRLEQEFQKNANK